MRLGTHHLLSRPRLAIAAGLALAMIGTASPAGATPFTRQQALASVEHRVAPLRSEVSAIRGIVDRGGAFSAVRAAALAAHRSNAVRGVRAPARPVTLAQAERTLMIAVRRARAIVKASPAARLGRRLGARRVRRLIAGVPFMTSSTTLHVKAPSPAPALRAAAIVARAVDASIPALRRAAALGPHADQASNGCDEVDQSPNLCVGGTASNVYTQDEAVIVDLGGDDTYRNNAGGAPNATTKAVSLVVDLSGNDTYSPPSSEFMPEGGGAVGGVGLLVDLSGSDTYGVVNDGARKRTGNFTTETASAQGQGAGAVGGAGFLIDGVGNDTYSQTSVGTGTAAGAGGEGEGFLGGVGALIDGGGDDTYTLQTTALPTAATVSDDNGNVTPVTQYGGSGIAAQGVGVFAGTGLLVDSGGTDSFTNSADLAPSPPDDPAPVYMPGAAPNLPAVAIDAQGVGVFAGAGLLLEGAGNTSYSSTATVEPVPTQQGGVTSGVFGQGNGDFAGSGVLSDTGGDDSYTMAASTTGSVAAAPTDACQSCGGELDAAAGVAQINGQGFGALGNGLLDDGGGNDRYSSSVASHAELRVDDQRSAPAAQTYSGTATAPQSINEAQGVSPSEGSGALLDAGGDDSYSATVTSTANSNGSASLPANDPQLATSSGGVLEEAQGAAAAEGQGALVDLGGSDSYSVASSANENGSPSTAPVVLDAQGAAAADGNDEFGLAVDLDGVGTDTYKQSPPDPACTGIRGQGVWEDCGTVGLGVNE
jgi:hypothetical protein